MLKYLRLIFIILSCNLFGASFEFTQPTTVAGGGTPPTISNPSQIADDCWVATNRATGQYVYAAWRALVGANYLIQTMYSADYGVSWLKPSTTTGNGGTPNLSITGVNSDYPKIATSTNGQYVYIGWTEGVNKVAVVRSIDRGVNWVNPSSVPSGTTPYIVNGGVTYAGIADIKASDTGQYVYLDYAIYTGGGWTLKIARSTDYGNNFSNPATQPPDPLGQLGSRTLATSGSGQYTNLIWQKWTGSTYVVYSSRSTDYGNNWSSPVTVNNGINPQAAASSSGQYVYAAWDNGSVQVKISNDYGASWQAPTTVTGNPAGPNLSSSGKPAQYAVVATSSSGQYVYAVWEEQVSGNWRIAAACSNDYGVSWVFPTTTTGGSSPYLSDPTDPGKHAVSARIASDSTGQYVYALWIRNNGSNYIEQAATSSDYGVTWQDPSAVTGDPSGPNLSINGYNAGYHSIVTDATGSYIYPIWGLNSQIQTVLGTVSPTGTFSGTVTDSTTSNPIENVTIQVLQGETVIYSTTTGALGTYTINDVEPGTYTVRASITNYQTQDQTNKVITPGGTTTVNFSLAPNPGTFSGTATDATTSNPIENVTIQVLQGESVIHSTTTNASGYYEINGVAAEVSYTVRASITNYQTQNQLNKSIAPGGTTTVNFSLTPNPGTFSGTVTDATTSSPIENAAVQVLQGESVIHSTTTNASGYYEINGVAAEVSYTVRASITNYQTQNQLNKSIAPGGSTTVNFSLTPDPGKFSGTVTDSVTSNPIQNVAIEVLQAETVIHSTTTNASGYYEINGVAAEVSYTVRASAATYQTQSQPNKSVTPGGSTTVNFSLVLIPGTITGTVTDSVSSNPIANAAIQVLLGESVIYSTTTGALGTYTINNVAPETYTVRASAATYQTQNQTNKVVAPGGTTTVNFSLVLTPGVIIGTVTDAITLAAIQNASAEVFLGETLKYSATTGALGTYTINGIVPNTYTVRVSASNYQTKNTGVEITPGETDTMNFSLSPNPGIISGTVVDSATSAAIVNAAVDVLQGEVLVDSVTTSGTGYYIDTLSEGVYTIRVTADGYQTKYVGIQITPGTGGTINFQLDSNPGTITGTVTDSISLNPLENVEIAILQGRVVAAAALTNASGTYSVNTLAPGNYTVRASFENYRIENLGARVTAGGSAAANFSLDNNPGAITGTVTSGGSPVENARVSISQEETVFSSVLTDSSGNYTVDTLAPGNYVATVYAQGYRSTYVGASVTAGASATANFSLSSNPGSISGTVRNGAGNSIAGASIDVFFLSYYINLITSVLTDSSGNYTVGNLGGNVRIRASAKNYQSRVSSSGMNTVVNFSLNSNPSTVSGVIRDSTTLVPIGGAVISVLISQQLSAAYVLTDSSGNYVIDNLQTSTRYSLSALRSDYRERTVNFTAGQTNTVNLYLLSLYGRISGTVMSGGSPVQAADVSAYKDGVLIKSDLANLSGHYMISNLPPGVYKTVAAASGYQSKSIGASVAVGTTSTVNFSLTAVPGTVSGTVTDTQSGSGIGNCYISIYKNGNFTASDLTDSSGNYSITSLSAGSYTVTAIAANYRVKSIGANVTSGNTSTVNFSMTANPGTVSGTVIDGSTSDPIMSAAIEVYQGGILSGTDLTDPSGGYFINNLSPGSYTVKALADNYQVKNTGVIIAAGETKTVNFSLSGNPGTITGTITDSSTSNSVEGATVEVYINGSLAGSALSNPSGVYTINSLPPGSYQVKAQAENYQTDSSGALVTPGSTKTVNFSLDPNPGTVTGTVTDSSTSSAIAGAQVKVYKSGSLAGSALANPSGSYAIYGLAPANDYMVTASFSNYQTKSIGVRITAGGTKTVNFSLVSSVGTVTGTVIDSSTSNPISGATAAVMQGLFSKTTITDPNGIYSISGLAGGWYVAAALAANYQDKYYGIPVTAGQSVTADFSLAANPGTISGTVTDSSTSNPIKGAVIQVYKNETLTASTLTDPLGNYEISSFSPGTYNVKATADNYQTKTIGAPVTAGGIKTVNFSLDPNPGSIAGTVTDALTSAVISGVLIEIYKNEIFSGSALTDPLGQYTINNLAAGNDYKVKASFNNYRTKSLGARVVANETTTVDFSLSPNPGTIAGTVTSSLTSAAISGAAVEVFKDGQSTASVLTGPLGNYIIYNLAPSNEYTVRASASNYRTANVGAQVAAGATTTANIALTPVPGTISGTIINSSTSNPIAGVLVQAYLDGEIAGTSVTDPLGGYAINILTPGSYTVKASAANYQTKNAASIVSAGQTQTVDFSLTPNPVTITGTITDSAASSPIGGAMVKIYQNAVVVSSIYTDALGIYMIDTLSPGNYIVKVLADNYQLQSKGAYVPSGSQTVNFSLMPNPGSIAGTVTSGSSTAIYGASVGVFLQNTLLKTVLTDANGSYSAGNLGQETYQIVCSASNYRSASASAYVFTNRSTTVNFSLAANPFTVSGTVTNTLSSPISNTSVELFSGQVFLSQRLTDSSGNYSFTSLDQGSYKIKASKTSYQTSVRTAAVLSSGGFMESVVDFELEGNPCSISGTVTNADTSNPIAGVTVKAYLGEDLYGIAITDPSGNYTIEGLPPGSFVVTATVTNYSIGSRNVVLNNPGDSATADFEVMPLPAPPAYITGTIISNRFLTQIDRIHEISWEGSPSSNVAHYNIYRDNVFIGTGDSFSYMDHNRNKKNTDSYTITSVDSLERESSSVSLSLR